MAVPQFQPGQEAAGAWLNSALEGHAGLDDLETRLSGLLAHLDGAQADTAAQVDSQMDDIARSVPRLTFDLQLMREHALLLRFTLDNIRKQTAASSTAEPTPTDAADPAAAVMDELAELSLVQSRMQSALAVLREAESWSTLDAEVSALIADQAYPRAAARLAEAARSMVVFQNTSEYESRRALMVSLQNGLEASLSNALVQAIADRDLKACREYFGLFAMIQREGEFRHYYYGSRRGPLVAQWAAAHNQPGAQQSPAAFLDYLPTFFTNLLNMLTEELAYLPAIFPDPQASLAALLQSTVDALVPSLHQRVNEVAESAQQPLPGLIAAYHHAEEFGLAVQRLMNEMAPPPPPPAHMLSPGLEVSSSPTSSTTLAPPTPTPVSSSASASAKERRLSKRYSMSSRKLTGGRSPSLSSSQFGGAPSPALGASSASTLPEDWEISLFEPFLDLQVDYAALEQRQLDATVPKDPWTEARALSERCHGAFAECEAALGRCIGFTHGYGVSAWADLADTFLSRFIHVQARKIGAGASGSAKHQQQQAQMDLEGLDYTDEDWEAFQNGAKLLGVCRLLEGRLHKFESKSKSRLAAVARDVKSLDEDAAYLIPGTTRGALTLLRQSTLMSADLTELLASVGNLSAQRPLFPHIAASVRDLTTTSQMLLHDTILRPLVATLSGYAGLSVWADAAPRKGQSVAAIDIHIPTFSLSPTDTMARLGEGLFNLPRLFEVYADDDALSYSLKTLPNLDPAMLEQIQPSSLEPEPQSAPAPGLTKRHSLHGDHPGSLTSAHARSFSLAAPQPASAEAQQAALSVEEVVAAWLASLTNTVLTHLTTNVLPSIDALSSHGAQQLASDLSHISNVAKTFEVDNEDLERWREAAEMSDAEGRRVVQENGDDPVLSRVARMRQWR